MAIVWVKPIAKGTGGSTDNTTGITRYRRTWLVKTNNLMDGSIVVKTAAGIPSLGVSYITPNESDLTAVCVDLNAERPDPKGNPFLWEMTANYSNEYKPDEVGQAPWNKPALWAIDVEFEDEALIEDLGDDTVFPAIAKKKIVNSAGVPFDPPYIRRKKFFILRISRATINYSLDEASGFYDTMNETTWQGFAPGKVKCNYWKSRREVYQGTYYDQEEFEFAIRTDNQDWQLHVYDMGREKFNLETEKVEPIIESGTGRKIDLPVFLDGLEGQINPPGTPPHLLDFIIRKKRDFNQMNIVLA